ncbi:MAG: allantoinase AllB [Candidatus Cloacimonadota bacterium]|nr:allantoinase AllB [Candidatus Cloacimonadota bacterium]
MIIKNTLAALPGKNDFVKCDILIKNGKIAKIGNNLAGSKILDVKGKLVFPGVIDPHVHLNDPGFTEREDFYTGTCAAAAGGVTTIIDMPCTSLPPVTTLQNLHTKLKTIESKAIIDFALYGGISGESFNDRETNIAELSEFVPGFKTYLISGMESFRSLDHFQLEQVLKTAKKYNRPILVHAEDVSYIQSAQKAGFADSVMGYYQTRPEIAEMLAVKTAVTLAESVGADLHVVHVSSAAAAQVIASSAVTGETAPHYLNFDLNDFQKMGTPLKVTPPVKKAGNREKLWQFIENGDLDFIATDHAPAPAAMKNTSILQAYSGIPGLETSFTYLYNYGFLKKKIGLARLLEIISFKAAQKYRLKDKGAISVGNDADLIIFDQNKRWRVNGDNFYSKGKITPFQNEKFQGKIEKTLLRGKLIFDDKKGIIAKPGTGEFIKP